MARTTRDVVALWQTLSQASEQGVASRSLLESPPKVGAVDLTGLTVGVYENDGVFEPSGSVKRAVREAASHLEARGARLVPYAPPDGWGLVALYVGLLTADGGADLRAQLLGQSPTPQLRTLLQLARTRGLVGRAWMWGLAAMGEGRDAQVRRAAGARSAGEWRALEAAESASQAAELSAWDGHGIDLVVGPPTVTPAAIQGETSDWLLGGWHAMRWSVVDLPAGVVPVSSVRSDEEVGRTGGDRFDRIAARFEVDSAGLPLSAQVIGRPGDEATVLAAMMAIEDGARERTLFPRLPVG